MFRYAQTRLIVIISEGEVGGIGVALNSIITCLSLFQKHFFKEKLFINPRKCLFTEQFCIRKDVLASNQCLPEIGCEQWPWMSSKYSQNQKLVHLTFPQVLYFKHNVRRNIHKGLAIYSSHQFALRFIQLFGLLKLFLSLREEGVSRRCYQETVQTIRNLSCLFYYLSQLVYNMPKRYLLERR